LAEKLIVKKRLLIDPNRVVDGCKQQNIMRKKYLLPFNQTTDRK